MPLYTTHCERCHTCESRRLTFEAYDAVQRGDEKLACPCGARAEIVLDPGNVNFVLRDGESGGWASRASKENKYRAERRQRMAQRQRDHVNPNRLVPNFKGQETSSWAEAKRAAYESTYQELKGEGHHDPATSATYAAETYDPLVKQEATK